MADRDRYDWERGRDFDDRGRDYPRPSEHDRGYQDRGVVSRGADEVRSWFGDDEARRRRDMDEARERQWNSSNDRDYGPNSERARREHGWGGQRPDTPWEYRPQPGTSYGDQRDFVSRSPEWNEPSRQSQWGGGRDYGEAERGRREYSGSTGSGQPNPSFSGRYGGRSEESGNYRGGGADWYGAQPLSGSQWSGQSGGSYGRDFGTTGEGRWGQQQNWAGGMSHAGRGPRNYQRSDDRIREDVSERLTADHRIDASDIEVRVASGEVTLIGTVDDRRTRRLAEEIIEDLPGVKDVRNDLRVNRSQGASGDRDVHRTVGEQSRGREDGALGHTGNPQTRDDVTTINTKDTKR